MLNKAKIVSICTILAQIAAFLRVSLTASYFGATATVDSYNLALIFPSLVTGLSAGWLQVSFVGPYIRQMRGEGASTDDKTLGQTVFLVFGLAVLMMLTVYIGRSSIAAILVSSNQPETRYLVEYALALCIWSLVPNLFCDFLTLVLNCHGHFLVAALSPTLNAIASTVVLWLWPQRSLDALLYSLILGWLLQLLILLLALKPLRLKLFDFFVIPSWHFLKRSLILAAPILPAALFSNLTSGIVQVSLNYFGEGLVSIYGYAAKMHNAVTQILVIGVSTVLLPQFAKMVAENKDQEIKYLFRKLIKSSSFLFICLYAGIYLFGETSINILLNRGLFDSALSHDVWITWLILTTCVLPFALSTFYAKLFQAKQLSFQLSISSLISLCVTWITCYFGKKSDNSTLMLFSLTFSQIFVLVFFDYLYRRMIPTNNILKEVGSALFKSSVHILPLFAAYLFITGHEVDRPYLFYVNALSFIILLVVIVRLFKIVDWIQGVKK